MKHLIINIKKVFIVSILLFGTACSVLDTFNGNECKNRASIDIDLKKYVSKRFPKKDLVRFGIMPLSVPANFTAKSLDNPDFGVILAQKLQSYLLPSGLFSTVEIISKPEWPGKKEEFFSNNLTALSIAKNSGLDIVLLGYLAPQTNLKEMTLYTKIIDVRMGITLFYGETTIYNSHFNETTFEKMFKKRDPSDFNHTKLTDDLIACHSSFILNDED